VVSHDRKIGNWSTDATLTSALNDEVLAMQLSLATRKLIFASRTAIGRRGFKRMTFAGVEHCDALRDGDYQGIVDIGANRGQFAMIARHLFPQATIISFEPLPAAAEIWREIFRHDARAVLHEKAIAPATGQVLLNVTEQDDSSSLLKPGESQNELFGTKITGQILVRAGRLSDFLERSQIKQPALLKVDVQGFEIEVLKGCKELLRSFQHIYVECSYIELYEGQALVADVIDLLHTSGFRLRGTFNQSNVPGKGPVQADFLFERTLDRTAGLADGE
jgi:FkbM family methyltransferase